ncbi:hypothetical protein ACFL1H_07740 [Nanoarchaeota archaeon]
MLGTGFLGIMGAVNVYDGGLDVIKYYSKIDSIRYAVYINADKITPEVIQTADDMVNQINIGYSPFFSFALAGFAFSVAYLLNSYFIFPLQNSF